MIPKTINILGIPYTVEKPDRITVDGVNADGSITYNTALIKVVDGMPIEVERATLLHEIMHAMFKGQGQHEYQHDEALLEAIAHGVVQIMRDNPELVAYIMGMETNGTA